MYLQFIQAVVVSLVVALASVPLVGRLAHRIGAIDLPDVRKVHRRPTPRLGGLAIVVAMLLAAVPILIVNSPTATVNPQLIVVIVAAMGVFAIGVIDDLRGLGARKKLLRLVGLALLVMVFGVRFDGAAEGPLGAWTAGWWAWPLTLLWLVAIPVALNFLDGLDGLAGGIATLSAAAIGIAALALGQHDIAILALATCGASVGFLCHNRYPASIFMGDGGAMFLGFVLASLTALLIGRTQQPAAALIPGSVLLLPVIELTFTMMRRGLLERRSLFSPENGHLHHKLKNKGLHHRIVVIVINAALLTSLCLMLLTHDSPNHTVFALGVGGVLLIQLGLYHFAQALPVTDMLRAMRNSQRILDAKRNARDRIDEIMLRMRYVKSLDEWWAQVCDACSAIDLHRAELVMTNRDGSKRSLCWASETVARSNGRHSVFKVSIPVPQRRAGQMVSLDVVSPVQVSAESTSQRIAVLSQLVEQHNLKSLPKPTGSEPIVTRSDTPGAIDLPISKIDQEATAASRYHRASG